MSSRQVEWLVLLTLVLTPAVVWGQPPDKVQQDGQPSLEFLEFLGFWETPSGELIDPLSLRRKSEAPQQSTDEAQASKEKQAQHHE